MARGPWPVAVVVSSNTHTVVALDDIYTIIVREAIPFDDAEHANEWRQGGGSALIRRGRRICAIGWPESRLGGRILQQA